MQVGHVFTIEPMINCGSWQCDTWPDDWTIVTQDGKRSAQFEHCMTVTPTGVEVMTLPPNGLPPYYRRQLANWGMDVPFGSDVPVLSNATLA